MKTNPCLKQSDDPVIERAAADFLVRAARTGYPKKRGMSLRIGNLVMIFGVPLSAAYYEVFKNQLGDECIRLLSNPSESDLARLSGD